MQIESAQMSQHAMPTPMESIYQLDAAPGHQQHILVVDDDSSVLNVITQILQHSGYDVTAVSNAEDALLHLRDDPGCELVLTDVMMPDINGFTLLDVIGRNHSSVPVVMLTAMHDLQIVANAFRHGAIDYLPKPFNRAQLLEVVARSLPPCRIWSGATTLRWRRWATRSTCATPRPRATLAV
jgi:PleD family two-component response regulator